MTNKTQPPATKPIPGLHFSPKDEAFSPNLANQAEAWHAVCAALNDVAPDWMDADGTATEAAVLTIRKLADAEALLARQQQRIVTLMALNEKLAEAAARRDEDGDALRLAVKHGIGQIHHQGYGQVMHPALPERIDFDYAGDPCAATRRAIKAATERITGSAA